MKISRIMTIMLCAMVCSSLVGCQFLKKKVPPQEMFKNAEQLRKGDKMIEAAAEYDKFFQEYEDSELAPAALYYAGICKFTLGLRCPGKQEFEEKKDTLSESKKQEYTRCLEYMESQHDAFVYHEGSGKYFYTGLDFGKLINSYPASNLLDDAALHLLRAKRVILQQTDSLTVALAIEWHTEFLKNYPQSSLRQKAMEDLLQIVSNDPEALKNPQEVATSYQALAQVSEDLPELNTLAYVLAVKCLELGDTASAAAILGETSVIGFGVVETRRTALNIRGGEGTKYKIVGKADKGAKVLLLSKNNGWYHVYLQDGTLGYAHGEFIREVQ